MLFGNFLLQMINNGICRINSNISHNKNLFNLLIEIFVYTGKSTENRIKSRDNVVSCLRQSFYKTFKKTWFSFCHLSSLLFVQLMFYQIDRNKRRHAFFLHRNTIKSVCRIHRASSMGNYNKLCVFRQFF